jgi:2-phosphoglycerate kinase
MFSRDEQPKPTPDPERDWRVPLLGGVSGSGKSTVARRIGLHRGISWLHLDDFRLEFQHSRATLPQHNDALYLFWDKPDVFSLPPEQLRDALIGTGEALSPAVEIVALTHMDHAGPMVLEGDGIIPAIVGRPLIRDHIAAGRIRAAFLVESDEDVLLRTMLTRDRGMAARSAAEHRAEARAKWLFGQWLAVEAARHNLPTFEARPWDTLAARIVEAVG